MKYTGDRPRQPAYEIELMLWRVSSALAQISCFRSFNVMILSRRGQELRSLFLSPVALAVAVAVVRQGC